MTASLLCQASFSQLLIIDVQERLAGSMEASVLQGLVRNTNILVEAATTLDVPILRTEQYPRGLGPTLPDIADKLPAAQGAVEKTCFSCCGASGIASATSNETRPQIILTGMETHICVLQTALDLQLRGNQVFVVADAVCSRRKQHHQNALARLQQAGIVVSNTESVLFEWLQDASHPQFKSLSKLIR
ncbi:MAG: isochorismatase family protein [Gammaproteobacteria bacterium]